MNFDDKSGFGFGFSSAGDANSPARPDTNIDIYSLTIGEASSLMVRERCKFASNRKVQRMCRDGVIDCYKLQTTRNGQPVAEWLVNEASLLQHIKDNEITWDEGEQVFSAANGNSKAVTGNAIETPNGFGDAIIIEKANEDPESIPNDMALPKEAGEAYGGKKTGKNVEDKGDAVATPNSDGDADKIIFGDTRQEVGETSSLAGILIENAKLTAQLEGANELIAEVRDDREFLREELKEVRAGRKDVTAIAERMLETLETIAIGGKLMPNSRGERQAPPTSSPAEQIRPATTPNEDGPDRWSESREVENADNTPMSDSSDAPILTRQFTPDQPSSDPLDPFKI